VLGLATVVAVAGDLFATLVVVGRGPARPWRLSRWLPYAAWSLIRRQGQRAISAATRRAKALQRARSGGPRQDHHAAIAAAGLTARRRWLGAGAAFFPLLLITWLALLVSGYAAMYVLLQRVWTGSFTGPVDVSTIFFQSGSTLLTLGASPREPTTGLVRAVTLVEALNGVLTYALVISFIPTLYMSYSRREAQVRVLDAGSSRIGRLRCVDLVRHFAPTSSSDWRALDAFLGSWEVWMAEVIESHLSFPLLAYLRSQNERQSWLTALRLVADVAAAVDSAFEPDSTPSVHAHSVVRRAARAFNGIAQGLHLKPRIIALPSREFDEVYAEIQKRDAPALANLESARERFKQLQRSYVGAYVVLARHLMSLKDFHVDEVT
jgi:hypothetical protein